MFLYGYPYCRFFMLGPSIPCNLLEIIEALDRIPGFILN
jgi:hypothetical protein